jgi:DHA2 family multidrug resistance protein
MLNLFRQIGGSIGIATLSTLLQRYNSQNYTDLVSHVSLLNPNTWQAIHQSTAGMAMKLQSSVGLSSYRSAALKGLDYRIQRQVFAMSFDQLLWVLVFAFAGALIPLAMIKVKSRIKGPVDAH